MISKEKIENFNNILTSNSLTIFCAESVTAGLLASTIASIPGASSVLLGSIVTYNKLIKTKILNVSGDTLETYTAESQETTNEMCRGLKVLYPDASIYLAVTGVASPSSNGYLLDKEVGQIYLSILYKDNLYEFSIVIDCLDSEDERNAIRDKAVEYIFEKILSIVN